MARAIVLNCGPLAASSATKVSLSQKAAGAQYLVLNGAAGSFTDNNICLSQTPAGAIALTLNGSLSTTSAPIGQGNSPVSAAAISYFATPSRFFITSAGNDSGITFAVVGTLQGVGTFGPGVIVQETITGANASVVSSTNVYSTIISITTNGAAAGAVKVGTYGPATLDAARRVLFTDGGNDSAITVALAGTDWSGNAISETVTLTNGSTVASTLDYLSVTSIKTSGAVATTISVGTNGVAGSPWARFDELAAMGPTALQIDGSGTVNWTVQNSLSDVASTSDSVTPVNMIWVNHPDSNLVASTTTTGVQGNYAYPPKYSRIVLNSQTNPGKIKLTILQNYQK